MAEEKVEKCICPKCGIEAALDIDDTVCEFKDCPDCKSKMVSSDVIGEDNMSNDIENMVSESLHPTKPDTKELKEEVKPSKWMKCSECDTVVNDKVWEHEKNICPKCGNGFEPLLETSVLDTERRFNCPKCSSSYKYSKINEDACAICGSLMTVFDIPTIKKSDTRIPIGE